MKRFCLFLSTIMLTGSIYASATDIDPSEMPYKMEVNYMKLMHECAKDGSDDSLLKGRIYEQQRNLKLEDQGLVSEQTQIFLENATQPEVISGLKVWRMEKEHLAAARVYERLHDAGLGDVTIAGILGNMMSECGGQTLDLQWWIHDRSGQYYGLCMWSLYYGKAVDNRDLDGQIDYLLSNVKENIKYFGGNWEYFTSIQDPGYAAIYFCTYYERGFCGYARSHNAYTAYNWITK